MIGRYTVKADRRHSNPCASVLVLGSITSLKLAAALFQGHVTPSRCLKDERVRQVKSLFLGL